MNKSTEQFNKDPRRMQEFKGRPYADKIYNELWQGIKIKRFELEDNYLLDKEFAIDIQIIFNNGLILTGQEKFLSYEYLKYNSLTVEHLQNWNTGELGDWYKMAVQFCFISYFNKDNIGFYKWAILNWPSIVINTYYKNIIWIDNRNKNGRAKASFKWYNIDKLPEECIIKKGCIMEEY
jgi:hypothetical protein